MLCLEPRVEYAPRDHASSAVVFDPTMTSSRPYGRPRTRFLISSLITSPYLIQIEETSGGSECVPPRGYTGCTGSVVKWNPSQTLAPAPACRCIYLGHELCHANQLIRGLLHPSERFGGQPAKMRYEMLTITGRYGRDQAHRDAVTENELRREHHPLQNPRHTL